MSTSSASKNRLNIHSPALVDPPPGVRRVRVRVPAPAPAQQCRDNQLPNNSGDYFSAIIEQRDDFKVLKGRTEQDIWTYVNLSEEELDALTRLRLYVRSTGIVLIPSPKVV